MSRYAPFAVFTLATLLGVADLAYAQLPIRNMLERSDNLKRRPNDDVEGTIWDYKGKLTKGEIDGKKAGDKDVPALEGMWRLEGEAIFAVGATLRTPGAGERGRLRESLRSGKSTTIKMQSGKPKRVGQYRISDSGRLIFTLDDESEGGLFGTLTLRKDKDQKTVYFGDFKEKEGKKTIRTWRMTVRKVQD
ncbi:MAG: hypothetical protein AAGJ46_18300 [Planctomycetota bacterium]